jgi:hypothetical protein
MAVDLTKFSGYSDLCQKLEEMFDIQGGSSVPRSRSGGSFSLTMRMT